MYMPGRYPPKSLTMLLNGSEHSPICGSILLASPCAVLSASLRPILASGKSRRSWLIGGLPVQPRSSSVALVDLTHRVRTSLKY